MLVIDSWYRPTGALYKVPRLEDLVLTTRSSLLCKFLWKCDTCLQMQGCYSDDPADAATRRFLGISFGGTATLHY